MSGHWPSLDTIALAQTAVVAVLLVTQFVPQPHVSSGVADQGGLAYGVPLASFVVMAVSLAAGFGMLLTGASRSGARLRYGVLAVVTLLLAIQPVTSLISADAGRGYSLVLVFSAAQLAILAVWWMRSTRPVLVWVLLPAYYLLAAGVWLVYAAHGRATAGTGVVLHGLAAELVVLPLVLVFPILSFSTDWVNRVQAITRQALLLRDRQRGRPRFSRPLPYATAIIAAALLAGEILAGKGLAGGLAAVLVMTVIMIVLIRLAGIDRRWPRKVARPWIFAGAAVFVIVFLLLVDLDPFPPGRPELLVGTAAALARVPLALAALLLAVVFILKGRDTRPRLAAGGLLLAMVALVILTATYPAALAGLGLRTPQPRDILGAVDVGAAAAALGWLGLLWYTRHFSGHPAGQGAPGHPGRAAAPGPGAAGEPGQHPRDVRAAALERGARPAVHAAARGVVPAAGAVDIPGADRAAAGRRPAGPGGPARAGAVAPCPGRRGLQCRGAPTAEDGVRPGQQQPVRLSGHLPGGGVRGRPAGFPAQ